MERSQGQEPVVKRTEVELGTELAFGLGANLADFELADLVGEHRPGQAM